MHASKTRTGFYPLIFIIAVMFWVVSASGPASSNEVRPGEMFSEFGCEVNYEHHVPVNQRVSATVLLAHGFMRNLAHMRGWAESWADDGVPVVIVSLCNSTLLNGHHARNAGDMQALREKLGLDSVVYAGFSAGGLAAYLAASQDEHSVAYLGLDSVDSGSLAISMETPLTIPTLFLKAQPSACNARSNFDAIFTNWPQYRVELIPGATHCHFESPYDTRCGWLCGRTEEFDTGRIQADIDERALAWLEEVAR